MKPEILNEDGLAPIGIAEWCLDCRGPEAAARAAELGFSILHVDYGKPGEPECLTSAKQRQAVASTAQKVGVHLGALAVNVLNDFPLEEDESSALAKNCNRMIEDAIDAAASLNIPIVLLPSFEKGEVRNESQLRILARRLRSVCEYAETSQILIASENSLGVEDSRRVAEFINHPQLRFFFDTQNPTLFGHDPVEIIFQLRELLCSEVHVKDGNGAMGNAALGTGTAGVEQTLAALKRAGFVTGWVIENEYDNVVTGCAEDVRRLRMLLARRS